MKRLAARAAFRALLVAVFFLVLAGTARAVEAWIPEPMPPGFRVQSTEVDGPVFADARGMTLYRWPFRVMRNGVTGDPRGESACLDTPTRESAGLMSPYPAGLLLPELETRPACTAVWPPALAAANAEPVGNWSIITRKDGRRQWAYDGSALYTSVLDREPGDVLGGDRIEQRGDNPAVREPIAPAPDLPPGFTVVSTLAGRQLLSDRGFTIYASDADRRGRSACEGDCLQRWAPVVAPASGRARGDWRILERADGTRQWVFRGRPLYRHLLDTRVRSREGTDAAGWHIVYVQEAPPVPRSFTAQVATAGLVLADSEGRTIYAYSCGDDAADQLGCDHPTQIQVYRLALCGGGSAERCLQNFPYVEAARGERANSRICSILHIDPLSGRLAEPDAPRALRVWAYRQRPLFRYSGDRFPGDINADGYGEFRAERQAYKAFWLRMDYQRDEG